MVSREWDKITDTYKDTIIAHQDAAPVKLSAVARALGLSVKTATLGPGISGEIRPDPSAPNKYIIRVNRHDSARRQRFTVAHEIAHFLLHREQIGKGIRDDVLYRSTLSDSREAEANRLASDILMPQRLVLEHLEAARAAGIEDLSSYLADKFEVSEAAMRIRMGL